MHYGLMVGLISFLPMIVVSFFLSNPLFFWSTFLICLLMTPILSRSFSLEISPEGIRQKYFGCTLYLIRWNEIESVTYSEGFPGPRYKIKARGSWVTTIDLPIEDENFPAIKKALGEQGLVLAKAQLNK